MNQECEAETALFHDTNEETGFFLGPDSKWDGKQASQLYILAISQSARIQSLRDLNASHLGFLTGMRDQILKCIAEK